MATSKIWAVHGSSAGTIAYIENEHKTLSDDLTSLLPEVTESLATQDGRLIHGLNCDPFKAYNEMLKTKEEFSKLGGVQAYHGYISFGAVDKLNPMDVLAVSKEIANRMWGDRFQVVLAVHTNTATLHCHFVANSVSFLDGKKMVDNEHNYYYMRHVVDEVCKEYGLSTVTPYGREKVEPKDVYKAVSEAIAESSGNSKQLIELLSDKGYTVIRDSTVRAPDGKVHYLAQVNPQLEFSVKDLDVVSIRQEYVKKKKSQDIGKENTLGISDVNTNSFKEGLNHGNN